MNNRYHSPYEAYPFLADQSEDYRCDFELLTDEMASMTGFLRSVCQNSEISIQEKRKLIKELEKICELIYHFNPTMRTKMTISEEEVSWLKSRVYELIEQTKQSDCSFVLPLGSMSASSAHVLRVKAKEVVRLLYRMEEGGAKVLSIVYDFSNLLSGYFFHLALYFNHLENNEEIPFISRNYSVG